MSNLKINEYTGIPRAPGLAVLPSTSASSRTQSQTYDIKEDEEGSGTIPQQGKRGLPFDEECKLVYGVLFSLRSMMKKLSKKEWVNSILRLACMSSSIRTGIHLVLTSISYRKQNANECLNSLPSTETKPSFHTKHQLINSTSTKQSQDINLYYLQIQK